MDYEEALDWLRGNRSMTNIIPQHPFETWEVRIAQADAAKVQAAYWIARAHKEKLVRDAADELYPMHKFKCEKCDGSCELAINVADLEDVLPELCPSDDTFSARWVNKATQEPTIKETP